MKNLNFKMQPCYQIAIVTGLALVYNFFGVLNVKGVDETPSSTPEIIITTSTPAEQIQESTSTTPPVLTYITLNIRYQDTMTYSGQVALTTTTYHDKKNDLYYDLTGTSTVFSSLVNADTASNNFSITDAIYNEGYASYYVRCLTIETPSTTEACDNWNYTVDGVYPSIGMDKYPLFGGETVYVFFSVPWQITATTSTFPIGTTTTLQTWRYQYDNLQNPQTVDGNDTVDISITNPNPTGWWDTNTTIATTATDDQGTVDYLFTATGTFFAKISSEDYSKWSNTITITVNDIPTIIQTPTTTTPINNGTGSSSNPEIISQTEINNTAQKILNYLKSQQDDEGKIIDGGITDWAIMSFAANDQYASDIKKNTKSLLDFATNYNFTDASDLNICASYPRHVLALLAAGIAKDDAQIQTMTKKIQGTECYKDNKFGLDGINDDVFALLALNAVDVPVNEPIIVDITNTITKDQTVDGASTWAGWASADITGAAVNALQYAKNKGAVVDDNFFEKAKKYLKQQQVIDGGWGDALSTSWVLMGINSLNQTQTKWINPAEKNPWSSMVRNLKNDGYYDSEWTPNVIDWFATKHAVPALLGKSWPIILPPQAIIPASAVGGSGSTEVVTTTPTSTISLVSPTSSLLFVIKANINDFLIPSTTETIIELTTEETKTTDTPSSNSNESTSQKTVIYQPKIAQEKIKISEKIEPEIASTINQRITEISNNTEFRPVTSSTPKLAKEIFSGSVALAGSLGLYLGWRLLQSLI